MKTSEKTLTYDEQQIVIEITKTKVKHPLHDLARPFHRPIKIRGQNLFKNDWIKLFEHVRSLRAAECRPGGGSPVLTDVIMRTGINPGDILHTLRR